MRKLVAIAIIASFVLAGCQSTGNAIGTVFNPIIGTWTASALGVKTEMVYNSDKSTTETVTILGVSTTKNGRWDSNDTTIARTWSDGSLDVRFYSFSSKSNKLILSESSDGIAISYNRE